MKKLVRLFLIVSSCLLLMVLGLFAYMTVAESYQYKWVGDTGFCIMESRAVDAKGVSLPDLYYAMPSGAYMGVNMPGYPKDVYWDDQYLVVRCFDRNNRDSIAHNCIIEYTREYSDTTMPYHVSAYDNKEDCDSAIVALNLDMLEMKYTDNHIPWRLHLFN